MRWPIEPALPAMKGPEAFRTISEAAEELGVPQHVLRFWESKFSFIRPMKRAGGRRFYRPQDLDMLKGVRALLREEGYTIKGVQRLHKEQGTKRLVQEALGRAGQGGPVDESEIFGEDSAPLLMFAAEPLDNPAAPQQARLMEILDELTAAKARLSRLLDEP